jgi:hypothetical protein
MASRRKRTEGDVDPDQVEDQDLETGGAAAAAPGLTLGDPPRSRFIIDQAAGPVSRTVTVEAVRAAIESAWALRPERARLECVHCWGTGRQAAIQAITKALGL